MDGVVSRETREGEGRGFEYWWPHRAHLHLEKNTQWDSWGAARVRLASGVFSGQNFFLLFFQSRFMIAEKSSPYKYLTASKN
jgi:hypothetical protein